MCVFIKNVHAKAIIDIVYVFSVHFTNSKCINFFARI